MASAAGTVGIDQLEVVPGPVQDEHAPGALRRRRPVAVRVHLLGGQQPRPDERRSGAGLRMRSGSAPRNHQQNDDDPECSSFQVELV